MAKKKLLLAHKLLSAMLSLLFHNGRNNNKQPPISRAAAAPPDDGPSRQPVVRRGALPPAPALQHTTLVVDVDAALLRSGGDLFPYFMLVALEAGGFLRGLVLLLLYPLLRLVGPRGAAAVRTMAAVSFCGLRAGARFRAGRAVLPKWLMEDVAAEAFDALRAAAGEGRAVAVVCATAMPRVMVEGFLREYLGVDAVVAPEMKVLWGFYTGLMEEADHKVVVAAATDEGKDVVGFAGSPEFLQHPLARCCKVRQTNILLRTTWDYYYNWDLFFSTQ
jgi:glycerol-3-phosphate acyltransferase